MPFLSGPWPLRRGQIFASLRSLLFSMSPTSHHDSTIFSVPMRWAIRVLAWLAFFVASYLAWHAAMDQRRRRMRRRERSWLRRGAHEQLVEMAQRARVHRRTGMLRHARRIQRAHRLTGPRESRWIDTLVVMLSIVAAGGQYLVPWLAGVRDRALLPLTALSSIRCGIALGALAIWSVLRGRIPSSLPKLNLQMPARWRCGRRCRAVVRVAPLDRAARSQRPSLAIAFGGAGACLAVLDWRTNSLAFENVTNCETVALDKPIDMIGAIRSDRRWDRRPHVTPAAQTHVALRIPTDRSEASAEATADEHEPATTAPRQTMPANRRPKQPQPTRQILLTTQASSRPPMRNQSESAS